VNTERAIKNGQSEEPATHGTQDEDKKTKTKTQHNMCLTPLCASRKK